MTHHTPFRCPKCGGSHFGSRTEKRSDGSIWKTHEECHDEFGKGCNGKIERLVMVVRPKHDKE